MNHYGTPALRKRPVRKNRDGTEIEHHLPFHKEAVRHMLVRSSASAPSALPPKKSSTVNGTPEHGLLDAAVRVLTAIVTVINVEPATYANLLGCFQECINALGDDLTWRFQHTRCAESLDRLHHEVLCSLTSKTMSPTWRPTTWFMLTGHVVEARDQILANQGHTFR